MTTQVRPHNKNRGQNIGSMRAGTATVVLGILLVAAVAYASVLSLSESFNPPHWIRVVGLLGLPIGFCGVPIAYAIARTGEGRARGRVGVVVTILGLAGFTALLIALG
jgi:hypothetical protein